MVTGPPRSICALKQGTTLPRLPRTLPNLTTANDRPERRAASCTMRLAIRFDAPMTPLGETALSVEIATNRFAPDCSAGDEYRLAGHVVAALHAALDLRSPQQVGDLYVPQPAHTYLAVQQLEDTGYRLRPQPDRLAGFDHLANGRAGRRRHGDDHLVNPVNPDDASQRLHGPEHGNFVDPRPELHRVVVEERHGLHPELRVRCSSRTTIVPALPAPTTRTAPA